MEDVLQRYVPAQDLPVPKRFDETVKERFLGIGNEDLVEDSVAVKNDSVDCITEVRKRESMGDRDLNSRDEMFS